MEKVRAFPEADRVALRIAGYRSKASHFPADFGGAHRLSAPLLVNLFTDLRGRDTGRYQRSSDIEKSCYGGPARTLAYEVAFWSKAS